jgi:subtilisin family serine protease
MKKLLPFTSLLFVLSFSISGQTPALTNQVILKFKKEVSNHLHLVAGKNVFGNKKIDRLAEKFHAKEIRQQTTGKKNKEHIYIIRFPKATSISIVVDEYIKTGEMEYAEPDYHGKGCGAGAIHPNDTYYSRQWGLYNDGTFSLSPAKAGADMDMENAWGIQQGNSNIVVGIIDSGTKLDHPEFSGRIWTNSLEIANNGLDDDNNGRIDDVNGWDFANNDNNPTDDLGHGTNVTGIIGANGNNSTGFAGVDWNCKLMILKGLNSNNFGYYSWWADAIYYAVDNGAKIINMSLAGSGNSITLQNAVNYALANNVSVIAAMGNENSSTLNYPAAYPGVIAVGSTDPDDHRSNPFFWSATSGSNYGSHISVVAPGNYIYGLNYQSNTSYDYYYGGTSQATPPVTGLSALLLAGNSSLKPAQVKSIIEITAEDRVGNSNEDSPGWDQYYGYGRINAFKALSLSPSFWTGSISTDWETAGNWSSNSIPGENTDVIIPKTPNQPVIHQNTSVRKIFVLKTASVTILPGVRLEVRN